MTGYYSMLRRGFGRLGANTSLELVYAILTLKCNLRCIHCYIEAGSDRTESMPMEIRKKVVDESSRYKAERISFSGGEVTTEMDKLVSTLEYAREVKRRTGYPKEIVLQTNGVFLAGYDDSDVRKELEILRDSGVTHIDVTSYDSYHYVDKDELERIGDIANEVFEGNYWLMGAGETVVPIGRAKTHMPRKNWRASGDCDINVNDFPKKVAVSVDGGVHPCACWQAAPIGNISSGSFDEIFERYELSDNALKKIGRKNGFDKLDDADILGLGMSKEEYDGLVEEFGGNGCGACKEYFKKHSV